MKNTNLGDLVVYSAAEVAAMPDNTITTNKLFASAPTQYGLDKMILIRQKLQVAAAPLSIINSMIKQENVWSDKLALIAELAFERQHYTTIPPATAILVTPAVQALMNQLNAKFGLPYSQANADSIQQTINALSSYKGYNYANDPTAIIGNTWIGLKLLAMKNYITQGKTQKVGTPESIAQTPEGNTTVAIVPITETNLLTSTTQKLTSELDKIKAYFAGTYTIAGHTISKAVVIGGGAAVVIGLLAMTSEKPKRGKKR